MTEVIQDLKEAIRLLQAGICYKHLSENIDGKIISDFRKFKDEKAIKFCLIGALYKATQYEISSKRYNDARKEIAPLTFSLTAFHDDGGDSIKLLATTISRLENE